MKKLLIKCAFVVCLAMGISYYMMYIMTGQMPFDANDISMPDISLSPKKLVSGGKETVYKWVDANGVTQYSSEPPPEQKQATALELDPNINIIQKPPVIHREKAKDGPKLQPSGPIYSPGNVKKLLDDAKNVEKVLDDRFEQQKKTIDGL